MLLSRNQGHSENVAVKALVSPDDPLPVSFGPIWWFWADAFESLRGELIARVEELRPKESSVPIFGMEFECDDERLVTLNYKWGQVSRKLRREVMYWWLESIREQFEAYGDPIRNKNN